MNWTQIANGDPGGTIDQAFASMSAETIPNTLEKRVTDVDMARDMGFSQTNNFLSGLQAAIDASAIPQRVMRWIETVGLDVNNAQVATVLGSLATSGYITNAQVTAVLALGRVAKYPGLQKWHIEKARRLRLEGKA